MNQFTQTDEFLDSVAKVLLRSTGLGFLLLLLWFAAYMLLPGPIHAQAGWFGLSPHETDLFFYGAMAFVKMCVLVFLFFPYVSIRLVLRRKV